MYTAIEVKEALEKDSLSSALMKLEVFANTQGQTQLAEWAKEERSGISSRSLDDTPKYRLVTVSWFDIYGRPLIIQDPNLVFVYQLGVVDGVEQLESHSELGIRRAPAPLLEKINSALKVDLHHYDISTNEIKKVLSGVKNEAISRFSQIISAIPQPKAQYTDPCNFSLI